MGSAVALCLMTGSIFGGQLEWPVKRIILVVPTKLCTEICASEVLSEIDFMHNFTCMSRFDKGIIKTSMKNKMVDDREGKNYNETEQWFCFVYMLGKNFFVKSSPAPSVKVV